MPSVPVETLHKALREVHERAAVRVSRQAALAEEGPKFLDENQKRVMVFQRLSLAYNFQ